MIGRDGLSLGDGRQVDIERVEIMESTAGILEGSPNRIWEEVLMRSRRNSFNYDGKPGAYVVLPAEGFLQWMLPPRWLVSVELVSEPLRDPMEWRSSMALAFFSDDLNGSPLPLIISTHLADITEEVWVAHSWDWTY